MIDYLDRFTGVLLGCAIGDAVGLPREGLSKKRAAKLFGETIRHDFVLGHGMFSDDTELLLPLQYHRKRFQ